MRHMHDLNKNHVELFEKFNRAQIIIFGLGSNLRNFSYRFDLTLIYFLIFCSRNRVFHVQEHQSKR